MSIPSSISQDREHAHSSSVLRRGLWCTLGVVALVFGAVGTIVPVLPTTPFVILAAFAFSKASPQVERWLITSRVFGPIIADWRANGAIAPRYKVLSLSMMASVFSLSLIMRTPLIVLIIQVFCITGAAAFILSRPSRPAETNAP